MTDQLKIANSALIKLGVNRLTALTEQNKAAILINEQYDKMRRNVLRDHPWNFAIARTSLALLASAPEWEYAYQFQLPIDCLRVLTFSEDCDWRIEGRYLLSNSGVAKIKYIKDVTDHSLFDDSFAEALSWKIAADLAFPLVQSQTLAQQMMDEYKKSLAQARTMNAQEGTPPNLVDDIFLNVRF